MISSRIISWAESGRLSNAAGDSLGPAFAACRRSLESAGSGAVAIAAAEPVDFVVGLLAAVAAGRQTALFDPRWTSPERLAAGQQTAPVLIWDGAWRNTRSLSESRQERNKSELLVPTGGTGGPLRFARHDPVTLNAAARGFLEYFQVERAPAFIVLPFHHVGGLMSLWRALVSDADCRICRFGDLTKGLSSRSHREAFLSLVPTQLERLRRQPFAAEQLRKFAAVFLGGAAAPPNLLQWARAAGIPLAPAYGMTETAAQIAAMRPAEFLEGDEGVGTALPHVRIELESDGTICVDGPSLFHGYHPESRDPGWFVTGDLGRWDENGRLHVLGRKDAVIVSGGENIHPAEIEAAIQATGLVERVAVRGWPHPEWGHAAVAYFLPRDFTTTGNALADAVRQHLAPYKIPKAWVLLEPWPETALSKVPRTRLPSPPWPEIPQ